MVSAPRCGERRAALTPALPVGAARPPGPPRSFLSQRPQATPGETSEAEGLGGQPGLLPFGAGTGGRRPTALLPELQEFVAQCFSSFLLVSPFSGPWYEQERCSAVANTGCVDCPQTMWGADRVLRTARGTDHIERHLSQLSRAPGPREQSPQGPRTGCPPLPAHPRLEQKPHSCLHAATCGSHVSDSFSLLPPRSSHSQAHLTSPLPARLCQWEEVSAAEPACLGPWPRMALRWLSLLDVHD